MSEICTRCGRELKPGEHAVGVTGGDIAKEEYFRPSDCDPYISIYCKKCYIQREYALEQLQRLIEEFVVDVEVAYQTQDGLNRAELKTDWPNLLTLYDKSRKTLKTIRGY